MRSRLPPEVVYDYVADISRHGEWAQHRLDIAPAPGAAGAGATAFESVGHQLGRETHNKLRIIEASRPRRFAFEAEGREGRFRHSFDIAPSGQGSRLTKTLEILELPALIKLALPIFALLGPRNMRKDVSRIKARLESGA